MKPEAISTSGAPAAIGPYSQAVKAGGFLFVSGQIPLDPESGEIVAGGIEEQAVRVLENVKAVLEAAGLGLDSVVKTTIYMADLSHFAKVNRIYASYFDSLAPARATVEVSRLPGDALLEMEAVAFYGPSPYPV